MQSSPDTLPSMRLTRPHCMGWLRGLLLGAAVLVMVSGCASRKTRAPVVNLSIAQVDKHRVAGTYTVKAGDTLFSIARSFNTSVAELTRLNDLLDPGRLWAGQVLRLRDGTPGSAAPAQASTRPSVQPVAQPAPQPRTSQTPAAAKPAQTPQTKPAQAAAKPPARPAAKPSSKPSTQPPAKPATPTPAPLRDWGWPAQGNIIRSFSTHTKGIDIAGKAGDPVRAAAAGTVRYVGNGVRGLGNLVLIEHDKDFLSVYAHNQKLLVTVGQQVKKGERIALLGQSDTTSPRLHFEIRRNGTPINPINHLPKK